MAHNTRTRADLAAWNATPAVSGAEANELDQKGFTAINGDDGGTWAPSTVITIGGMGVTVSGDFKATSASDIRIVNTGSIDVLTGGTIAWETGASAGFKSGSGAAFLNGSTCTFSSTAVLDLGIIDPTYTPPRNITRTDAPRLKSRTVGNGGADTGTAASTDPDAWDKAGFQVVHRAVTVITTQSYDLEIPGLIDGATLTSITVDTKGLRPVGATLPGTFPTYEPMRDGVSMHTTGAVTDAHAAAGTWFGATLTTTIPVDTNNVLDRSAHSYWLHCTPAAINDGTGATTLTLKITATYSVPKLKPN
jgi:hypothetical protein